MITCKKCGENKEDAEYTYLDRVNDIKYPVCRTCRNAYVRRLAETYTDRVERMTLEFRICPGCEKTLPTSAFAIDRCAATGLQPYCRHCRSRQYAERTRTGTDNAS